MFHHHDFSLSWIVNMQRKDQQTSIKITQQCNECRQSSRMMYGKSLPTNYRVHFEVRVALQWVLRDPHISL